MATEILRPHDILSRPSRTTNQNHHPKPFKKRRDRTKRTNGALFIGNVKILKRGESIESIKKQVVAVSDSGPKVVFGPANADMKQVQVVAENNYAGSAFWSSPAPTSLPIPRFSMPATVVVDELATMGLRRFLRLE